MTKTTKKMTSFNPLITLVRGALVGSLLTVTVHTDPSPAHRPQVGPYGTYYAKTYQRCMADCIKRLAAQKPPEPLSGDLAAIVEIICQRPKTTKFARPRGDVDNYAKAPMDAATKTGIWVDDVQVATVLIDKRWTYSGEKPGITMTIGGLPPCSRIAL